jgi:hypothetical protein
VARTRVAGRGLLPRSAAAIVIVMVSVIAGGGVHATPPTVASSDTIVVRWNAQVLEALPHSTIGPPMAARALAIVHTCMYDAWAAYDPLAAGTRHGGRPRRPVSERTPSNKTPSNKTAANKTEAMSYAAHRAAVDLFPGRRAQFDAFMISLGFDPDIEPSDTTSPAGVGVTACAAVLAYRHADASNQTAMLIPGLAPGLTPGLTPGPYADWTRYRPANAPMVVARPMDKATVIDPDRWQPLTYPDKTGRVNTPPYLAPHWGHVRPFALPSGSIYRPLGPPRYGSAEYARQAEELLIISANLTDRQKASAEYWADGPGSETPPGHWCLFAQFMSRRSNHDLDQDVKMFFAVTNAVMDAGIAAWNSKRTFDSVRPITAIRYLYHGKQVRAWAGPGRGTQVIDGATWTPYQPTWFPTPPFPEYVSGHSTFIQRRGSGGAEAVHRQRHVRLHDDGQGGILVRRAEHHPAR